MRKFVFACALILSASSLFAYAAEEALPDPKTLDFDHPEKYNLPTPKIAELTGDRLKSVSDVFDYYLKMVQPLDDECSSDQSGFSYKHYGTYVTAPCMQQRLEMISGFANIRSALTPAESIVFGIYMSKRLLDANTDPVQKQFSERQVRAFITVQIDNAKRDIERSSATPEPESQVQAAPAPQVQAQASGQQTVVAAPEKPTTAGTNVKVAGTTHNSDPDGLLEYFYGENRAIASPSFKCDGKLKPHEKAICDNARLSILEEIMVLRYYQVRETKKDVAQAIAKANYQRELVCGADVTCLTDAIEDTTKNFMSILNIPFYLNGSE